MLNSLRQKSAGIVMKILLGLIVISFAVWGVEDMFRVRVSNVVASVGDTDITVDAVRDRWNQEIQFSQQRYGRQLTAAEARAVGIDRQVLAELMANATLQEQAKRLNLAVPDADVARSIVEDPTFRDARGQFDQIRFQRVLSASGMNEPMYVALQRNLLLRRQIIEGVAGGVQVPAALSEAVFKHQNERRSASYVILPGSDGASIAAPDDATLQAFFEERKGVFQAPERRSFTLVAATAADLAQKEVVSDEDVRARYEQEKDRLGQPERRTIDRITFPSLDEAKAASDKIKGGATFDQIVTERGLSAADTSLGTVTKSDILDKPIADAAFALSEGQVSEPVEGQFSTVILRVGKVEPAVTRTFDDVKAELRTAIATERAAGKLLDIHDQIEDDRASGMTLAEVATKNGLELRTFTDIDRQGRAGEEPADIPGGATVLNEVYGSDVGVENNAMQIDSGYVWFDVTKIDPARERTFEEAKEDILARWRAEEARKALDAKVDEALKQLRDGTLTLNDLATRENVQLQTAEKIDRAGGSLGSPAAAQIFATAQGGFGSAPSSDDGRVVFQVTAIDAPAFDANAEETKQFAERIAANIENDLAAQYVAQLQSSLGASVNSQALATALGIVADQP